MKKKRILFAAVDIGFRIEHYSKYIKEKLGDRLIAESFSKYVLPSSHYKMSFTYTCNIYEKNKLYVYWYIFGFYIYSLFRYDIFHFFSGETLLTRKLRRFELWSYKLLGKRVVMHFVGADIRSPKYLEWKREHLNDVLAGAEVPLPMSENFQLKLIADARKYADRILVSTPDLLRIIPEATYFPVLLDLESFGAIASKLPEPVREPNHKLVILHSPSGLKTKGSELIHEVLKKIEADYPDKVELVLPGKVSGKDYSYALSRYELIEQMKRADIVIDQMVIGWYGLKSIEAIFLGCIVICYIDNTLRQYLFAETPIIQADIFTLEQKLIGLISDCTKQTKDNKGAIAWVNKHHTLNERIETLIEAWDDSCHIVVH